MADVRGTVSFGGRAVTSGALVFSPIPKNENEPPGKSATGDIQPDGSFQLSTHELHDGAVVGRHRVRFIPALDDEDEEVDDDGDSDTDRGPIRKFADLALPADYEVEVQSDKDNELSVELVKRSPE
jgi:hypothetical protein